MKLVARAHWFRKLAQDLGIKPGQRILALVIDQESETAFADELKTIDKMQHDRYLAALDKWNGAPPEQRAAKPEYADTLIDLDLTLKIHYSDRSIDANALYWSLLAIEANFLNGSATYRGGYWSKKLPGQVITPQQIHDDDLETFCQKAYYDVKEKDVFVFKRLLLSSDKGRLHHIEPLKNGEARIWVWRTTRFMNTKEFNEWTKRKINAIRDEGSLLKTDVPEFIVLKQDFLDMTSGRKKQKERSS